MNDLTDLRGALTEQADGLGVDRPGRLQELRGRVRGVRRRRRATAAVAAGVGVAVVVSGVVVSGQSDRPDPADRIVGVQPPASLSSLGYTYELADGVEGSEGAATVRLSAADQPRLVSWATSGEDQGVRVQGDLLMTPLDVAPADFDDWVLVPPSPETTTVTVRARSGEAGLAVYTLGEARPQGYSSGGVTFRDRTTDGRLLGAAVGTAGRGEVTTAPITAAGGRVVVRDFCALGPSYADVRRSDLPYLHVVTAEGDRGEICEVGPPPVDGGSDGRADFRVEPGVDLTTRVYLTAGAYGPPLDTADAVFGAGVYDAGEVEAGQTGLDELAEAGGHRYRLADVASMAVGSSRLRATAPDTDSALLSISRIRGPRSQSVVSGPAASAGLPRDVAPLGPVASPGSKAQIRLRGLDGRPDSRARVLRPGESAELAFYRRAD